MYRDTIGEGISSNWIKLQGLGITGLNPPHQNVKVMSIFSDGMFASCYVIMTLTGCFTIPEQEGVSFSNDWCSKILAIAS